MRRVGVMPYWYFVVSVGTWNMSNLISIVERYVMSVGRGHFIHVFSLQEVRLGGG